MTPRQARRREREWSEGSKRGATCPMCRRPFGDCPHAVVDVDRWLARQAIRAEVRAALKKAQQKQGPQQEPQS